MNWMNLKQWLDGLARDTGRRLTRVAPEVTDAEPPAARSSHSTDAKSAAQFWSEATVSGGQAAPHQPQNRRAARIRSWRRRALSRKGARLYSAMKANSQTGSLAMLDEGGMVVSWYERAQSSAAPNDRIVDNHMSQFYVAADLALGLPVRDLCSAAIHGQSTQTGWRRFPAGATCWATTVIEPIWLRDGRLQGFSHVTRPSSDAHQNVRAVKEKGPRRWKVSALRPAGVASAMLALMILGNFAHADAAAGASLPENARKSSYGAGWDCVSGYVRSDMGCKRVVVPANAYLDASGTSWACDRGYRNTNNACAPVQIPSNAYLDSSSGAGWKCVRGYREVRDACVAVEIPANAYAIDSSYGSGWECDRGFRLTAGACVAVTVPANAYLVRQGDDWKCDRGFKKVAEACTAVQVPPNAYLDSQGNSWSCERGFRRGETQCEAVQLPTNSHLSYSGDAWRCDSGFSREGALCTTPD